MISLKASMTCRSKSSVCLAVGSAVFITFLPDRVAQCRLVGNFANRGRAYQPPGLPEEVEAYDFPSLATGKGIPYGIYDMTANTGWVSVGTTHDMAQFAVA